MTDYSDTVVLYEQLAVQDVLPLLWRAAPSPPDPQTLAALAERNLQVLQAWDALEDHGPIEPPDENSPFAAELQRLDRKLSLLLGLVGQMLSASRRRPPAVPVRFNALGAEWRAQGSAPQAGTPGTVEIYVHECVAQPLRFAGNATSPTPDGDANVRFLELDDTVASLLGKIAFRRHRRQIAGRVNPQRTP